MLPEDTYVTIYYDKGGSKAICLGRVRESEEMASIEIVPETTIYDREKFLGEIKTTASTILQHVYVRPLVKGESIRKLIEQKVAKKMAVQLRDRAFESLDKLIGSYIRSCKTKNILQGKPKNEINVKCAIAGERINTGQKVMIYRPGNRDVLSATGVKLGTKRYIQGTGYVRDDKGRKLVDSEQLGEVLLIPGKGPQVYDMVGRRLGKDKVFYAKAIEE